MTAQQQAVGAEAAECREDLRVEAVLEVLGGASTIETAQVWEVEPVLLQRWVRDFVAAGTAQVTNNPDPETAARRDRFLAAVAHELRSPLAVARGWALMMLEGDVDACSQAQSAERLHEALGRLHDRTLDVELLAAASLGRVQVHQEAVPLAEIASQVPGLDESAITGAGPSAVLVVDRVLFARLLRDVWSTAWIDPEPCSVELSVSDAGLWTELRVLRRGSPIDPRVLQALFEPFDLNDDDTGVTIGLYLARALTVVHGGTIGVDQDQDDTALWVKIPTHPVDSDQEEEERAR